MMDSKISSVSDNVKSSEKYEADLEQALSVAGFGWYNLKYCGVLALFLIAAIVEVIGYSYVLPAARCDLDMTDSQRGLIASLPYIAIVVTSFFWGYVVDTLGRKRSVIYSSLIGGGFGILSGFMPELISFTAFKFLASLCIACPAAAPYTIIGEILPFRHRDLMLSITNATQTLGSALVPLLAWGVLSLGFEADFGSYLFRPWRLLTILYSSTFIISALLMMMGPESPKYLVSQGKYEEALEVLKTIYAGNKRKPKEDYPIKSLKVTEEKREKQSFLTSLKTQSFPLVKPPYVKWLALNGFLLFGLFAVLNGLFMWVPDILNRVLTGSGAAGMTACEVIAQRLNETQEAGAECVDTLSQSTFVINAIANFSCAMLSLAVSSTLNIIGKKNLLILMYFLLGTICIISNFITQELVFAVLLSSLQMSAVGIGPVNAFAIEIFPTKLRGMAVSLALMLGRTGSVVGTNVAGVLINNACEVTFYVFGGLLLVCGVLAFLLPNSSVKLPTSGPRRRATSYNLSNNPEGDVPNSAQLYDGSDKKFAELKAFTLNSKTNSQ